MTDPDILRRELAAAFANRADIYRLLWRHLKSDLGAAHAERVIREVLEERGREVAAHLFREIPPEAQVVADRFLEESPDGGRLYPHDVERGPGSCTIRVHSCPLKDAWTGAGLADEEVAHLCRLAGAFDKGLFEAAGVGFANQTWTRERGGGCCWITLTSKPTPVT